MSQEKARVNTKDNTYIVESNNDANLRVGFKKVSYCEKCGAVLGEDSLGRFCDEDCRSEYFQELRRDNDDIYSNVF